MMAAEHVFTRSIPSSRTCSVCGCDRNAFAKRKAAGCLSVSSTPTPAKSEPAKSEPPDSGLFKDETGFDVERKVLFKAQHAGTKADRWWFGEPGDCPDSPTPDKPPRGFKPGRHAPVLLVKRIAQIKFYKVNSIKRTNKSEPHSRSVTYFDTLRCSTCGKEHTYEWMNGLI